MKSTITHTSKYAVQNNIDLVRKMKEVMPPAGSTLLLFDVTGLFPNVPNDSTTEYLENSLKLAYVPEFIILELVGILKKCLAALKMVFTESA